MSNRRKLPGGAHLAGIALAIAATAIAASEGCSRDHEALAAGGASSSTGGATTTATTAGSTGGAGGAGGAAEGGSNAGAGAGPNGPSRLTVLDAIVDEDAIRFCFLPYPDGDPSATPWPSATAGLAFGSAVVIDANAGTIPSGVDVLPVAIGGDLALTAGKTCNEIIAEAQPGTGGASSTGATGTGAAGLGGSAGSGGSGASGGSGGAGGSSGVGGSGGLGGAGGSGGSGGSGGPPPPFVIAELGVVPASVFTSGRSVLLAAAGCLGGAGHDDAINGETACGTGYTSTMPTARLAALALSRITTPEHVSLQVVHASVAAPDLLVGLAPSASASQVTLTQSVSFGAASPSAPFEALSHIDIADSGKLTTYDVNVEMLATTTVGHALDHGDVTGSPFADGHAYAFVAIGSSPAVEGMSWWHGFTYAVIRSDP